MLAEINEKVFWMLNGHPSEVGDVLMAGVTFTGLGAIAIVLALLGMYLYKGLNKRNIILLAVSLALGGLVVHGIKSTFIADRPLAYFAEKPHPDNMRVHNPFERDRHRTFPSGHSQAAFGVATIMVLIFRRHIFPWLGWAVMVALSRVYLGEHFPLDVLCGGLVGALASFLTVKAEATLLKAKAPANQEIV